MQEFLYSCMFDSRRFVEYWSSKVLALSEGRGIAARTRDEPSWRQLLLLLHSAMLVSMLL